MNHKFWLELQKDMLGFKFYTRLFAVILVACYTLRGPLDLLVSYLPKLAVCCIGFVATAIVLVVGKHDRRRKDGLVLSLYCVIFFGIIILLIAGIIQNVVGYSGLIK